MPGKTKRKDGNRTYGSKSTKKANTRTGGYVGRMGTSTRVPLLKSDAELKFKDLEMTGFVSLTTGIAINSKFGLVSQNDTEIGRTGRKIRVKHIFINGDVKLPNTVVVAETSDVVRLMLIVDHQTNSSNTGFTDIYKAPTNERVYSFRNLENSTRFTVLKNQYFALESPSGSGTIGFGKTKQVFNWVLRNVDIDILFSGTGELITNATQNSIQLWTVSKSGHGRIDFNSRVRFYDA